MNDPGKYDRFPAVSLSLTEALTEAVRHGNLPLGSLPLEDGPLGTNVKIDHVGIAVRSITQAARFYRSLGLAAGIEEALETEGVRAVCLTAGEISIELIEPLREETTVGRFLARRGEGLHHIALRVQDIHHTYRALEQAGMGLASRDIKTGAGGHLYFFIHPSSTGGVLIEICQNRVAEF